MAKQAIKKKDVGAFDIKSIKNEIGIGVETSKDIKRSNSDKPLEWITLPEAYQEAVKLPGIPMGYLTLCRGWSDTGKSTLKNCIIASAMRMGIIPVIYETEGNFDFQHAIDCGMEVEPVYGDVEVVDEETGEIRVERQIINYEGNFIYFDNDLLAKTYGNRDYDSSTNKKDYRSYPVIEDIAYSMNCLLDMQDEGKLNKPLLFIWDSIGTVMSWKSHKSKAGGNPMNEAAALTNSFNNICNVRIPNSRKLSNPYTNTMFCVNKIWNDGMNSMNGLPSLELKGGKSMFFSCRLLIHVGGQAKASTKKLKATLKGEEYKYGMVTKIEIVKNHLPTPYNVTYKGEMCCVHNGIISVNDIDNYKKEQIPLIMERLKANSNADFSNFDESDIQFEEEDETES